MVRYPRMLAAGDAALTVEFGGTIDPAINDQVITFAQAVNGLSLSGLIETVPTYRSATVYFDPVVTDVDWLTARLQALANDVPHACMRETRTREVPVLYGGACGPDLPDLAAFTRLSAQEVIAVHASVEYRVYMLGFLPGFPYMAHVPDTIAMPRLASPRARVPKGSVGIAGSQTGIYPVESPGGWRLIGRTPLRLFEASRTAPFLLQPGDRVRFVSIDQGEYDRLSAESNKAKGKGKSEVKGTFYF
jgi:KipI family sensor histidine kinase inhibitor